MWRSNLSHITSHSWNLAYVQDPLHFLVIFSTNQILQGLPVARRRNYKLLTVISENFPWTGPQFYLQFQVAIHHLLQPNPQTKSPWTFFFFHRHLHFSFCLEFVTLSNSRTSPESWGPKATSYIHEAFLSASQDRKHFHTLLKYFEGSSPNHSVILF